jgi:hypothetical protein
MVDCALLDEYLETSCHLGGYSTASIVQTPATPDEEELRSRMLGRLRKLNGSEDDSPPKTGRPRPAAEARRPCESSGKSVPRQIAPQIRGKRIEDPQGPVTGHPGRAFRS